MLIPPRADEITIAALPRLPLAHRKRLPEVPAVYFVLAADNSVQWVGSSIALRSRWAYGHNRLEEFRALAGAHIAWLQVAPEHLRALEKGCLDFFDPPLNRVKHAVGKPWLELEKVTMGSRRA